MKSKWLMMSLCVLSHHRSESRTGLMWWHQGRALSTLQASLLMHRDGWEFPLSHVHEKKNLNSSKFTIAGPTAWLCSVQTLVLQTDVSVWLPLCIKSSHVFVLPFRQRNRKNVFTKKLNSCRLLYTIWCYHQTKKIVLLSAERGSCLLSLH